METLKDVQTFHISDYVNALDFSHELGLMCFAMDSEDVGLIDLRGGDQLNFKGHLDFNFSITFLEGY